MTTLTLKQTDIANTLFANEMSVKHTADIFGSTATVNEVKQVLIILLSTKFSEIVNRDFSPEELADVIEKNSTEEYADCCATHDYCDANMTMDEAFTTLMRREFDLQNEDDINLWNNAWDMSKENNFFVNKPLFAAA